MSPRVKSYAAPWLAHGSPGSGLFESTTTPTPERAASASPSKSTRDNEPGPRRTIARRGTEVFVAVGKEIRWGDLAYLKDLYAVLPRIKRENSAQPYGEDERIHDPLTGQGLRVLKIPVADDIRQLVISHNQNLLAVLTSHTVHICLIPDSSHLSSDESSPIRPKFWTLGPTTHVTSKSAIASALWHPLGVNGKCIVTVTRDAVVRVWELCLSDRWSFDSPTLSIDLKKLIDGISIDQDYTASSIATSNNSAFSPDAVEMEVAAAAFASRGSGEWSPMTLWIAMREGDLYAMCPLLPKKWAPPPTLIPSLSVSIVTKLAALEDDTYASEQAKLLAQNQLEWMGEIDNQEPHTGEAALGDPPVEIYTRPTHPGGIPRLQGPFDLRGNGISDDELDAELTDVLVIGKKVETDDLMTGEDAELELDDLDQEGLSLTVVCLLSVSGQVRAYIDIGGVEAQWLPPRRKAPGGAGGGSRLARTGACSLLAFQTMDTMSAFEVSEQGWPLFSPDVASRYSFYVTSHCGITFVSLSSWVFRLESDLRGESEAGSEFRIGLLASSRSTRDRIYTRPVPDGSLPLGACVVIRDPDVGYFLLSATSYEPVALTFEEPEPDAMAPTHHGPEEEAATSMTPSYEELPPARPLDFYEPRPTYHPSHVFGQPSGLPRLLSTLRSSRHRIAVNQLVRLSPLTLQVFTDAHKIVSEETHRLAAAGADVFRRCDILQHELRQQVVKLGEVKARVDRVSGKDGHGESDEAALAGRLSRARQKQDALTARIGKMRSLTGRGFARPLSAKEKAFAHEIGLLEYNILGNKQLLQGAGPAAAADHAAKQDRQDAALIWKRFEDVKRVRAELAEESERILKRQQAEEATGGKDGANVVDVASPPPRASLAGSPADLRVPSEVRKAMLQQVYGLLDRETAMVDAVSARLEKLQVGSW